MTANPNPAPKRRAWFQVHLSTCVVLMFVAGGLLWANVREREFGAILTSKGLTYGAFALGAERGFGWPLPFLKWDPDLEPEGELSMHFASKRLGTSWSFVGLAADLATALAVLALVAFLCEWPIRRRQRAG